MVIGLLIFFLNGLKKKQPLEIQNYFFKAFYLRVLGTFTLTFIYQFIFGYGDTFGYYHVIQTMHHVFTKDPVSWLNIILHNSNGDNSNILQLLELLKAGDNPVTEYVFYIPENAFICKIASVFNVICFNSYLGMALFFGTMSFLGSWYIFKTFVYVFPGYQKQFAIFCLYLPSLWFWGTGVLKDPVCNFALGLLFYFYFIKQPSFLKRSLIIFVAIYLLVQIKSYMFYSFAVGATFALVITYYKRFNLIGKILSIVLSLLGLLIIYPFLSDFIITSFEDITTQSKYFIDQYSSGSTEGDSTIIPSFDPSPFGFIKLALGGLVTVFLRPFPWEINKILYIFLIMENMLLYVIIFKKIKLEPFQFKINNRYVANFCLVFFLFLGTIIGVTSFNLGTIARYRVPALPFLFAGIFVLKLLLKKKKEDKRFLKLNVKEVQSTSITTVS